MGKNKIKSNNNNKLSNYTRQLEDFQNALIANNHIDGIYGDGKNLVNNEIFKIKNDFADQLYMRQMYMPKDCLVVSAMHHTEHFWFLLKGRILVTTDGKEVEHVAPCFEKSLKGAKRLILSLEDSIFINVHKNPTNTKNMDEVEELLYSITLEEYIKKEKIREENKINKQTHGRNSNSRRCWWRDKRSRWYCFRTYWRRKKTSRTSSSTTGT
jgi:mannose-6-phosphate isomerase-like protein (cupin superfamily)